jgi:type II secretory ATPase GspE/PulE/Tfp pilus assembly ATPase PilB-like protein
MNPPIDQNPDITLEFSIQSEEQFQERISDVREKNKSSLDAAHADKVAQALHDALKRQDSESALSIITLGALGLGSSDIHYDNSEHAVAIRMRIDGDLVTMTTLEKSEYKLLIERLKYKSNLKLNITDIPQDGKYRIADE